MAKRKKKRLTLKEKIANADKILAAKERNPDGLKQIDKVIKKAATPKRRVTK